MPSDHWITETRRTSSPKTSLLASQRERYSSGVAGTNSMASRWRGASGRADAGMAAKLRHQPECGGMVVSDSRPRVQFHHCSCQWHPGRGREIPPKTHPLLSGTQIQQREQARVGLGRGCGICDPAHGKRRRHGKGLVIALGRPQANRLKRPHLGWCRCRWSFDCLFFRVHDEGQYDDPQASPAILKISE